MMRKFTIIETDEEEKKELDLEFENEEEADEFEDEFEDLSIGVLQTGGNSSSSGSKVDDTFKIQQLER